MRNIDAELRRRFYAMNPQALAVHPEGGIAAMGKPNIEAIDSNLTALEKLAKKVEDELIELHQRERSLTAVRATPDTDEAKLLSRYGRRAI